MSASWLPPQRGQLQEPPTQVSGSIEKHAPLTSRSLPLAGLADVVDDEDDRAAQPGVVKQDVRVEPPPSTTRPTPPLQSSTRKPPSPSIFLMSSARAGNAKADSWIKANSGGWLVVRSIRIRTGRGWPWRRSWKQSARVHQTRAAGAVKAHGAHGMCLWRSLTRWQKLAEGCNIQVPMEAVSLINDGKNLDEFTRDVLNSCITKNQITKGKTAFSSIQ